MKKLLSIISSLGCFASMMLASAQTPNGEPNFLWSITFIALAIACGLLFLKLNPEFFKDGVYHE